MKVLHGRFMQCVRQPQVSIRPATRESGDILDAIAPHILAFVHAPGPGGVERIALRLIAGWHEAGCNVHLLMGDRNGPMAQDIAPGIVIEASRPRPLFGRGLRTIQMLTACLRAVRSHRPDILFCPGNSYTIVAVLLKLRLGRHCPPILAKISNDLIRDDMPWAVKSCYTLWLRIQGRLIDHFAALSDAMAREAAARLRIDVARIHVVPNPVLSLADLDDDTPPPESPARGGGRRFVAVGRLEAQKDYPLMLRAFAAGRGPDDRLTIYGEGGARPALESLSGHLGIEAHVHFAGFSADILGQLRQHDVLLLSSRYEGQPGAIVEALARGIGIIATRCCASMAPLLEDGALGMLVERGNLDAFAAAIRIARPGRQDKARAREKAAAFTIERAVPAYRALFRHILRPNLRSLRDARPVPALHTHLEAQPS